MKKHRKVSVLFPVCLTLAASLAAPALAITESEVETQVSIIGKAAVSGNVLLWFMCAIAFLKVALKIDSFMTSLGVNVGHTGGSMLAETMVLLRGAAMAAKSVGRFGGKLKGSGSSGDNSSGWFLKGGLAGAINRKITNDAVKTATTQRSAVHTGSTAKASHTAHTRNDSKTSQSSHTDSATQGGSVHTENTVHSGNASQTDTFVQAENSTYADSVSQQESAVHSEADRQSDISTFADSITQTNSMIQTDSSSQAGVEAPADGTDPASPVSTVSEHIQFDGGVNNSSITINSGSAGNNAGSASVGDSREEQHTHTETTVREAPVTARHYGIGGAMFAKSLVSGGQFANDVIGKVATGDFRTTGSIQGEMAAQAMMCYSGITATGGQLAEKVRFSDVEIGGGRITGVETTPANPSGISFAMYHTDKYAKPDDSFQKVRMADGTVWYKQYAVDSVVKTPYKAPDGEVAYRKDIVKKLPRAPTRKDRL